ncbi:alpha/beta hydrolase [Candidatus Gracilibacteria bacterium]|nr:alpha/beta hydrolase [Candidatus Gracilibacteria bacterium]
MIHNTGFVEVNGAQLYYEVRGSKAAQRFPPVILVHGLSLDHRMWDAQFRTLSRVFLTYRYDMRGHGQSDPVSEPVGLHDDLLGFMDAMGIQKAHLVGQSLGGNAVGEIAATHPERVDKVVLIDSGINGFQYPTPNVLQRIPTYLELNKTEGREAALQAWVCDPLFGVSFERLRVRTALEEIVLSCPCSLFFNPQFQIRPPTFERLNQIARQHWCGSVSTTSRNFRLPPMPSTSASLTRSKLWCRARAIWRIWIARAAGPARSCVSCPNSVHCDAVPAMLYLGVDIL